MVIGRIGARPAKGAAKGAGKAAFGPGGKRTRLARGVLAPRASAAGRRRVTGALILGGLLALGAAVALVLARRRGRGVPGPEDAASAHPPVSETARPGDPADARIGDREDQDRVSAEDDRPVRPSEPSSDPSHAGGPGRRANAPDTPPQGGIEERVRARIGEDPRTRDLPPVSIEVDDGMAWLDGGAPSQEAKEALTEVVGSVEGVNIVVNRVTVSSP